MIDLNIDLSESGNIVVKSGIKLTENLTSSSYKIFNLLLYDNGIPVDVNDFSLDRPKTRFAVIADDNQDFTLRTANEEGIYTSEFAFNPEWETKYIRAVSFVQLIESKAGTNMPILQAKMVKFVGNITVFAAGITSGPPNLTVTFTDRSITSGEISEYAWDFGDGSVVSKEATPTHTYTAVGLYSVKLNIKTNDGDFERKYTDMINVYSSKNVSGKVAGIWTKEHSPYMIKDDVEIPAHTGLIIEPGVNIFTEPEKSIMVNGEFAVLGDIEEGVAFTSKSTWQGVVMSSRPDTTIIKYAVFENAVNSAIVSNQRALSIENCTFRNNNNPSSTTSIHLAGSSGKETPPSKVINSFFANNLSGDNSNSAGAIFLNHQRLLIKNSVFVNNKGQISTAVRVHQNAIVDVENCTLFNNDRFVGSNSYGSIHLAGSNSKAFIINSIIDRIVKITNSELTVEFTNVVLAPFEGDGNLNLDPKFANPSEGVGPEFPTNIEDWYLLPDSPCVDKGNPDSKYNDIADPANPGNALAPSQGSIINDMGAFGGKSDFKLTDNGPTILIPKTSLGMKTYPNPFNPMLNIMVEVNHMNQRLNVSVFNIKGQKITELYNDTPKGSNLNITWNGKDSSGKAMSSGIYFVRANNSNEQAIKKVILLK